MNKKLNCYVGIPQADYCTILVSAAAAVFRNPWPRDADTPRASCHGAQTCRQGCLASQFNDGELARPGVSNQLVSSHHMSVSFLTLK